MPPKIDELEGPFRKFVAAHKGTWHGYCLVPYDDTSQYMHVNGKNDKGWLKFLPSAPLSFLLENGRWWVEVPTQHPAHDVSEGL